jgi:hypothetical protein
MQNLGRLLLSVLLVACGGAGNTTPEPTTPAGDEGAGATTAVGGITGQALADSIMAQWQRAHPNRNWEQEVRRSHPNIPAPADNTHIIGVQKGQGEGQTYGRYTERDVLTWRRETERLVLEGALVFHSADALGGTVAVSCDMCHPDAANTHPETYPKFQVQLGRVILLRDMINWCLINPVRAEPLEADDPRMRALEAYIFAQRKGTELDYGRH